MLTAVNTRIAKSRPDSAPGGTGSTLVPLVAALLAFSSPAALTQPAAGTDQGETVCETDRSRYEVATQDAARQPPSPYQAIYRTRFRGLSSTGKRQLERTGTNDYQLTHSVSLSVIGATVVSLEESSQFYWEEPYVIPRRYDYTRGGIGGSEHSIVFDWQQGMARFEEGDSEPVEIAVDRPLLDQFSIQAQLRLDIRSADTSGAPGRDFRYRVLDEDDFECHHYRIAGAESIETEAGAFDTIRVERVREDASRYTAVWLAPKLEYLMVRFEDSDSADLELESVTFETGEEE